MLKIFIIRIIDTFIKINQFLIGLFYSLTSEGLKFIRVLLEFGFFVFPVAFIWMGLINRNLTFLLAIKGIGIGISCLYIAFALNKITKRNSILEVPKDSFFQEDTDELRDTLESSSIVYLYKKNGKLPTKQEIYTETNRRERWCDLILKNKKYSATEAFRMTNKYLVKEDPENPPEDFDKFI